ncbi:sigma-54-dependent transcriptional regulator [Pelagicoccus mobilis]|uniref:Sigma-54-dependent Fis family transcriptional regulator n=1 Tax=Pelagicoccus mobilis TaxID=415221 RepID=A0A934RWC0_9BACT|nr:sigma-54 dependent transcriptional regulator [Pelagicoccus mobilis]MBK1877558.1 sigma-54-dependent Fis family transcriptional regulator [Pelagicoccus mobilis]
MKPNSVPHPRILVCDDEQDVLASARLLFKNEEVDCVTVTNPVTAFESIREDEFDMVLLDLNYSRDTTSGAEGLQLIERVREEDTKLPIVVTTAWATVEIAVRAMRNGANDFITKPWDNERLLSIVRNMHELSRLQQREQRLVDENDVLRRSDEKQDIVGDSSAMVAVRETICQIAPSDANILITGENGTGKSIFAKCIHDISKRSVGPFISVNMGGISDSLFESELFGHVKGAFTDAKSDRTGRFELADGGTLFLDEIGELSASHQTTLLRLLETGEFERLGSSKTRKADVRIISATNADLEQLVNDGRFRRDLYYRLNTVPIHMPPLRDREQDIVGLAQMFLEKYTKRYRKEITGFSKEALAIIKNNDWPGNVREMDHAVERAVLLSTGDRVEPASLVLSASPNKSQSLDDMSLEEVETYLIKRALRRSDGNVNEAADALGLSRSAFYRRLRKYSL